MPISAFMFYQNKTFTFWLWLGFGLRFYFFSQPLREERVFFGIMIVLGDNIMFSIISNCSFRPNMNSARREERKKSL